MLYIRRRHLDLTCLEEPPEMPLQAILEYVADMGTLQGSGIDSDLPRFEFAHTNVSLFATSAEEALGGVTSLAFLAESESGEEHHAAFSNPELVTLAAAALFSRSSRVNPRVLVELLFPLAWYVHRSSALPIRIVAVVLSKNRRTASVAQPKEAVIKANATESGVTTSNARHSDLPSCDLLNQGRWIPAFGEVGIQPRLAFLTADWDLFRTTITSSPDRADLIRNAVAFLRDPKASTKSPSLKLQLFEAKGLTPPEIDMALKQAALNASEPPHPAGYPMVRHHSVGIGGTTSWIAGVVSGATTATNPFYYPPLHLPASIPFPQPLSSQHGNSSRIDCSDSVVPPRI
ncbi:hypothetical protein NMY22_g13892 [Coprinellus aureogranulatus]|nr:hypothetical protein NMY22_g13892 [Coprinellus aureogranulatus]